jgi:hypothetical protein
MRRDWGDPGLDKDMVDWRKHRSRPWENRKLHDVGCLLDLAMALQDAASGPTAVWSCLLTRKT